MKTNVLDWLKLRVLSCYSEALMIKKGEMPPPRMAIVYPTYLCNHRCQGCDYTEQNKTKKFYSEEEFLNALNQLHDIGVKAVEFCGGGEPTLNPHLPKAMDLLTNFGLSFGLLTNGTNLTDDIKERLVKHGSYCRISLESATEETFNATKRPINKNASFDHVIENIKELLKLREERKGETKLQVSIKYCIDQTNYQDVVKAVHLSKGFKNIDSIQFKMIRNMPSELKDKKIIHDLENKLAKLSDSTNSFHILYDLEKSRLKGKCWLSPLQVTIDPYGDAYICCYYRHRAKKHLLGNIFKNKLKDVWYSQEHWNKINSINRNDCNKYDCRFHFYNSLMDPLILKDIGQLSFV